MIRKKNWISLILHFIISVGAMFLLVNLPFYNYQRLINDNDFYYNCITLSSIIGGFLFTGISILISALKCNFNICSCFLVVYQHNQYQRVFFESRTGNTFRWNHILYMVY